METFFAESWQFGVSVLDHIFTLLAGCVATVVINLIERHVMKGKKLPVNIDVAILLAFLLFACFQAWRDQYRIAQMVNQNPPPAVQVNVPPAQINLPPPQVIMVNRDGGAPAVVGYLQIAKIVPVPNMNQLVEGGRIGFYIYFENVGPMPLNSFQDVMTLSIGKDESKVRRNFDTHVRQVVSTYDSQDGDFIGVNQTPHFNMVSLTNPLTHDDVASLLNNSQSMYLQVWARWKDANQHKGELKYCASIGSPNLTLAPGATIFTTCLAKR